MRSAFPRPVAPWTASLAKVSAGRAHLLLLLLPLLPSLALLAAGPAQAAEPAAALLAATGPGAWRLAPPGGEPVDLALPPGAALDTVAALAEGWIAAGTAPAGGTAPAAGSATAAAGERELLLLLAGGDPAAPRTPRQLPPPAGRTGRLRAEPLPLVEDGRLAGLVWLEGDDRRSLAVRYAAWNGSGWEEPLPISPAGAGAQLALSAARLADGSWLLAWSAFDGSDDEIVWSRGVGGAWTRPARLTDNRVPDITPALTAAGGGAVIAWSQLAGDGYRLLAARFRDGRWSEPEVVAPGGSLYPSFEPAAGADRLRLLYRTALPRGWAALELDHDGRPLRLAAVADPAPAAAPRAVSGSGGLRVPPALGRPALGPAGGAAGHGPGGETESGPGEGGGEEEAISFGWPGAGSERSARWNPWHPPSPPPALPARRARSERAAPLAAKASPRLYLAFGDSITAGFGDFQGIGYPGRLQALLTTDAAPVTVVNAGLLGETTGEGVSRIDSVLQPGMTALLLMEGTNDINAKVSIDTTVGNLDIMAGKAEALGIAAIHATVIPRLPTANTDGDNLTTGTLAGAVRELAWSKSRSLVDPFEVFFVLTPDALANDYLGAGDALHPNAAGYALLAHTFADVLNGADKVPPVTGTLSPSPGQQNVPADAEIDVDLFDFGAGIDLANTHLLVNGQAVTVMPTGDRHKQVFRYQPPAPLAGVVSVGLATQDLASPPNVFAGTVAQFDIAGTFFLPGDLNQDGIVDGKDLILLAYCFGAHRFDARFRLDCDLNGDGVIDGADLAILAADFGHRSF
jgi:acyl-CoA thioesterase I